MAQFYAKVIDGMVVNVVTVESFDYITQNPDRYGDSNLYVGTVFDDVSVRGAQIGDSYSVALGFVPPKPLSTEFASYVWNSSTLNWEGQ